MKIETDFVIELIKNIDTVTIVGNKLLELWRSVAEKEEGIKDYYYRGEEIVRDFEELILKSYWEFYDTLAKACLKEKNVFQLYPNATIVIMDGMSIRESMLLYKIIKDSGYEIKHEFNFSAVPSDTELFRKKISISMNQFSVINDPENIRLTGNEKYIWSYFPDIMLDTIQVGHTVILSLETMYKILEKIVFEILTKIKSEKIVITSDHGYIRTEAGFTFPVKDKVKRKFQEIFGSKRYIKMDGINVEDLINEGYIQEFNGYYLAKSLYLWPVPGKYSIYIHGGLSLMECFIPVLVIERRS